VIATNVLGTQNVLQAVCDLGIPRCVVLSSDKAVDPANVYGCTKLAAERLAFVAARTATTGQRINVTRYGNVMGSRGSVLEVFRGMLIRGERCLPVTALEMTRFFMTIDEAVALVLFAAQSVVSGYLFVPQLPAFSLATLLRVLHKVDSLTAESDYRLIGIQPGEKLHESLLTGAEHIRTLRQQAALPSGDLYVVHPAWNTGRNALGVLPECHEYKWPTCYESSVLRYAMSPAMLEERLSSCRPEEFPI